MKVFNKNQDVIDELSDSKLPLSVQELFLQPLWLGLKSGT